MHIPPRKNLIPRVQAALAAPFATPLYLHGPSSTAKHATLSAASLSTALTTIDCILHHTDRQLYAAVAAAAPHSASLPPITDAIALVDTLRAAAASTANSTAAQVVVVFTRAERLASSAFPPSTLPLLFALPSLANRPDLRIVFISRVPFSAIRHVHVHPLPTPLTLFFPPLTSAEIIDGISFDPARLPTALPPPLLAQAHQYYPGYARSVVQILYNSTNNPHHLQRVADQLYPTYISFRGVGGQFNAMAAFNRVQDSLAEVLKTLNPTFGTHVEATTAQPDDKTRNLPRTARVLLVAAFLGSVVAPSQDMRHFTVERTSRKAGTQKIAANNSIPLERLLAIYQAVQPHSIDSIPPVDGVSAAMPTALLVHLSTLVALGWLVRDGGHNGMTEPKFRARITRDEALAVAAEMNMDIHDYLVFDK